MKATKVFQANYASRKRFKINQGGTSSGKTWALVQVCFMRCIENPGYSQTITALNWPTLKKDVLDIAPVVAADPAIAPHIAKHLVGPQTYIFRNGSRLQIQIFPTAKAASGPKRDGLFINEGSAMPYSIVKQLVMRTRREIFIDFNPASEFWAHDHYPKSEKADWFFSTYRDNPFADQSIIDEVEAYKITDPEAYKVYALGKRGALQGQVFPNVEWIETLPTWAGQMTYGLDIGFANSFTALCEIGKADGAICGEQLLYRRGLIDEDLEREFEKASVLKSRPMIVDSANQQTIEFLRRRGYNAIAAQKGRVDDEVGAMRLYKWRITTGSVDWKKEAKNYRYAEDGNGGFLNTPIKAHDHLWDAARYAFKFLEGGGLPTFY
jgi:phage terminase large subunit